jgi:hypothetical protein
MTDKGIKLKYLLSKQEILEIRMFGRPPGWVTPGPITSRAERQRERQRRRGRMWKYRNRQVMRKMDFDSPLWQQQARRTLKR